MELRHDFGVKIKNDFSKVSEVLTHKDFKKLEDQFDKSCWLDLDTSTTIAVSTIEEEIEWLSNKLTVLKELRDKLKPYIGGK